MGVRGPGSQSSSRTRSAGHYSGFPSPRLNRFAITSLHPLQLVKGWVGFSLGGAKPPARAPPNSAVAGGRLRGQQAKTFDISHAAAAIVGGRQGSPRIMITQAIRTALLASATETRRAGRRSSSALTQAKLGALVRRADRITAVMPTIKSLRTYWSPILVIRPS